MYVKNVTELYLSDHTYPLSHGSTDGTSRQRGPSRHTLPDARISMNIISFPTSHQLQIICQITIMRPTYTNKIE